MIDCVIVSCAQKRQNVAETRFPPTFAPVNSIPRMEMKA
jgi:hypothetical protein